MSSRSSNSAAEGRLSFGRIRGHRGLSGELTVRVAGGDAAPWAGLRRVWIEGPSGPRAYDVEHDRAYADRLVLKLRGVDDPNAAEELRGATVGVLTREAPPLSEGTYYAATLVGLQVEEEPGRRLGAVRELLPTAGTDLLVVETPEGREVLIPMARDIVLAVEPAERRIRVRLPPGLLEVNDTAASAGEAP